MPTRFRPYLLVASISLGWFLLTFPVAVKYMGGTGWPLMAVGEVLILGLLALVPLMQRRGRDLPAWVLPALWVLLVAAYVVIYPHTQNLPAGRGTDREDALRLQILALEHHQDPYAVRTFLNQLPTPLPGAIALAWPFFVLGRISFQNILWSGVLCLALTRIYRLRITAVIFLLVVVCLSLESLNDFVSGSDYVLNAIYVGLAIWLVVRSLDQAAPTLHVALACLLFGVSISSRPSYFMTAPPVIALLVQRRGMRTGLLLAGCIALAFAATIVPVFWPHPVTGLLAELKEISHRKTPLLPAGMPIEAISATALLVAISAFFFRLHRLRVYLVAAASTAVLIAVPMYFEFADAFRHHHQVPEGTLYLFTPVFFFSIWAFDRLEQPTS